MGSQNYGPARQSQGGDYFIDPELTAYVQSVGNKLAAVSDRKLPYEYTVLNDSVPNAWAMPGGKIAFNRGLLYELNSEAELAAVMGHEMVHAAARHGAKPAAPTMAPMTTSTSAWDAIISRASTARITWVTSPFDLIFSASKSAWRLLAMTA